MNKSEISSLLRGKNLKVTPPRVAILSLFSEKCNPMTAELIFEKLGGSADLVTIYRTLASFERKGFLRRVDLHKDAAYFELNGNHHHHHIVCTDCGKVEEFEKCSLDSLAKKVVAHSSDFAQIRAHSLEFFGICNACAKT